MRKSDPSRGSAILEFIDQYYDENHVTPTVRIISEGTGIAVATVHRYLNRLRESGSLEYRGRRSIRTSRMDMERMHLSAPVLGYVRCGAGEEESEEILEYIRLPESLVGKGDFFVLIAKGESMVDIGIYPGDYVVIRRQNTALVGEIVVALWDGMNNLKELQLSSDKKGYILHSRNEQQKEQYPDIPVRTLSIQGVAVCVMHRLGKGGGL